MNIITMSVLKYSKFQGELKTLILIYFMQKKTDDDQLFDFIKTF